MAKRCEGRVFGLVAWGRVLGRGDGVVMGDLDVDWCVDGMIKPSAAGMQTPKAAEARKMLRRCDCFILFLCDLLVDRYGP